MIIAVSNGLLIVVIIIGLRRPCPAIDLAGEGHAVVWQSGSLF